MTAWDNVVFWDNYWRTEQDIGSASLDFTGEPVAQTYNVQLNDDLMETGGYEFPSGGEHSDTHLWYHGTIDMTPGASDGAQSVPTNWYGGPHPSCTDSGYFYSRIAGGARPFSGVGSRFGSTANRAAAGINQIAWPNIGDLQIAALNTIVTVGDQVPVNFLYQDADSAATMQLWLDSDTNPYNSNAGVLLVEPPLSATGSGVTVASVVGDTSQAAPGDYYVYGQISDGNFTRFSYATDQITLVPAPAMVIGEVGRITNLTHAAQVISLQQTYINPVVFAQYHSRNGVQPTVVCISDVQTNQFTICLAEPSNLDGIHIGETFSYTVLEAGQWQLPNGELLEVGSLRSSATVGNQLASPQWETLTFASAFTAAPVILIQVQTNNDTAFVKTRQNNATTSGFQIALEGQEEAKQPHTAGTIGYLALEAGGGQWGEITYEGFNTAALFTDASSTLSFNQTFAQAPIFLPSLATYNGSDPSQLRYSKLTTGNVQVRAEKRIRPSIQRSRTFPKR